MMKKYIYLFISITIVVILLNIYINILIYKDQISFQQKLLTGQVTASANEIENTMMKFDNDVNALLYSNVLSDLTLFQEDNKQDGLKNLELLFINYNELIKNIHIYDNNKNVLNLSFNRKDKLLVDPYVTQHQNELQERQSIVLSENAYYYSFPVFKDNKLKANLVFTIDFKSFFASFFRHYYHDKAFWQYVTDSSGSKIFCNAEFKVNYNGSSDLKEGLDHEVINFIKHKAMINGKGKSVFSAFAPLNVLGIQFSVIFSMRKGNIFDHIINKVIISSSITTALLLLFLLFLLGKLGRNNALKEKESSKLSTFQSIFDNLPVGIMVLDQNLHTRIINQTARDMLILKDDASIAGKNLTDRFMMSKDYYDNSEPESAFDSNQFVLYRHEGEEVSVYKKDMPFMIENEELILSAFVDITPVEKARKYEAAANTAKSEFLAKMSHEIRTPMNGIIGMTEAFDQKNLTAEQKEYLQIVKRSSDLLLNLIDDLLDFSKIEAGKMQLEEIPFKLREEVKLAVDLFRTIIEEKNIKLTLKINPDVPDNIIGDSFRLRQVLSNLISNAVKFTHEGEIAVGIQLEEEYNNNLTLLFYVEDTGVGIPHSKIESIFSSFTQAEESISREYGGSGLGTTISKQLVNLMHGEIWVESPSTISTKPNYPGSKFSFTIEVYSNERQIK
jgi:signal transduction histidine kinase